MKAKPMHEFFQFASSFSIESMIQGITSLAFSLTKMPNDNFKTFANTFNYSVTYKGKRYNRKISIYHTQLLDVLYEIIKSNQFGSRSINLDEMLFLIHLHIDLEGERYIREHTTPDTAFWLNLFGNMGEQIRFQKTEMFFENYSREKYILETVSKMNHHKNIFNLNFCEEFQEITGFSTKDYSAILFVLLSYFSQMGKVFDPQKLGSDLENPALSCENIVKVLKNYSATIKEIKDSKFKRQIFYQKPFIEIEEKYYCASPVLLLCLFENSNYWIVRNKYSELDLTTFNKAFGKYFEIYLEEVLKNCISENDYVNLEESNRVKRADWHLKLGNYDFLIEQKSAVSNLAIKQTHPDIEIMKTHMLRNWGHAVKQLDATQKELKIERAIKIILVYEDYYNNECFDKLFEINDELTNDNYYWLVSINDFEKLIYTYTKNPDLFYKIVEEKIDADQRKSNEGRSLSKFLYDKGISINMYLRDYNIFSNAKEIEAFCY